MNGGLRFEAKQEQKGRVAGVAGEVRERAPFRRLSAWKRRVTTPLYWYGYGGRKPRSPSWTAWLAGKLGGQMLNGVLTTVETEAKYEGYLLQQDRQIRRLAEAEGRQIPTDFLYENIPGLSTEVRQKLTRVRPVTLGQAGRIPGSRRRR